MQVKVAAMVERLRCSTHSQDSMFKPQYDHPWNGMTLDKSLTDKLSRMAHSYCASVSTLEGRGAVPPSVKRKRR